MKSRASANFFRKLVGLGPLPTPTQDEINYNIFMFNGGCKDKCHACKMYSPNQNCFSITMQGSAYTKEISRQWLEEHFTEEESLEMLL